MLTHRYVALLTGQQMNEQPSETPLAMGQSAIFGSTGRMSVSLQQATENRRISLYPCLADGVGEAASGLLLSLGYLLSLPESVWVYPVLWQIGDDDTLENALFTPNDWVLDDLNDDVAIWGHLEQVEQGLQLHISVEDDATEGELRVFERKADNWGALLAELPALSVEIADYLGLKPRFNISSFPLTLSDQQARQFCETIFAYARAAHYSALTNTDFTEVNLYGVVNELSQPTVTAIATIALAYTALLNPDANMYQESSERLTKWRDGLYTFALTIIDSPSPSSAILTWCLEQLEMSISTYPEMKENWTVLGLYYLKLQRPDLAIEVCQKAFESQIDEPPVYFIYFDALSAALEEGLRVERLSFVDAGISETSINQERLISLERGLTKPDKSQVSRLAQYIVEANKLDRTQADKAIFSRLVELDGQGEEVDTVIQQLTFLEDVSWMIEPLEAAARTPSFMRLLNLARAYHLNDNAMACIVTLDKALALAKEPYQRAEAQLLRLESDVPSFQADLADMVNRIQRQSGDVYERDLEFLEYLVENAPDYMEGYLVLAAAYRRLDEPNTALEVLLDAEKASGGTPEIYLALAELLEQEDELSLAIENVRKGLDLAPMSVPLMAQAALLAYLSGDEDGAQAFLRRAHAVSPYHQRLIAVTRRIQADKDGDVED